MYEHYYQFLFSVTCNDMVFLNGMIVYNSSTILRLVGTVASLTCNTGYTLSGASTRTCQFDGQWSLSMPFCEGEIIKILLSMCMHVY